MGVCSRIPEQSVLSTGVFHEALGAGIDWNCEMSNLLPSRTLGVLLSLDRSTGHPNWFADLRNYLLLSFLNLAFDVIYLRINL